jgi:predicted ATPase
MLGRDRELERLRAQLERARSGRSGAVLVQGEAGIGKSALLEAIGDEAASSGCSVLRATGVASESTMAW